VEFVYHLKVTISVLQEGCVCQGSGKSVFDPDYLTEVRRLQRHVQREGQRELEERWEREKEEREGRSGVSW